MNKFLFITFLISVLVWGIADAFLRYSNKTYPDEHIAERFEPITSKYGIKIVYEIGDDFFSPLENPPIPAGPHRNSKVEPIRHRVLLRYPAFLRIAIDKYPIYIIKKYLNAIHFAGEIDQGGLKYGGSYDPFRKIIYIVNNGWQNNELGERVFHHEFSSLLLKHHSFFVNPWTDNNPKDFKYFNEIYDSYAAMKKARKAIMDHACYKKGIVTNYGLTNFENDFNEYSAMIFTYPKKFKKIMEKYPRVRGKFKVWLDFYQKIDPVFTEEYLLGK
jgi:hypothetical protein